MKDNSDQVDYRLLLQRSEALAEEGDLKLEESDLQEINKISELRKIVLEVESQDQRYVSST